MASVEYIYNPIWSVLNNGQEYTPFAWQAQHIHRPIDLGFKRIICASGRRSGKSTAVVAEVARAALAPPVTVEGMTHHPVIYIVGPTSETAMRVWEPIWAAFVPPEDGSYEPPLGFLHAWHDKSRGVIGLKNGARIYRKTADDPRSLQGERVTLIIVDEAQEVTDEAFAVMMPGLADSDGVLIAIGITKGRGRFRSYWARGQSRDEVQDEGESRPSRFYSSSVPTTANPIFKAKAREEGKTPEDYVREMFAEDLTEQEFKQQYLAQWVSEDGLVFSNFERLFTPIGECGGPYIMGLDIGKMHDFTVAYVVDVKTGQFVDRLRVNKIDYIQQVPKIINLYQKWNCRFAHMDTNGVGQAPAEMLTEAGCSVIPFKWSNDSKQALVNIMVREVEKGNFHFMPDDDVLKREMGMFEASITASGVIKYEAPRGYFDDCVIAAALAIAKCAENRGMAEHAIRGHYVSFTKRGRIERAVERIKRNRRQALEERIFERLEGVA